MIGGRKGKFKETVSKTKDIVYTPELLIEKMYNWASCYNRESILDPCAGDGRILDYFVKKNPSFKDRVKGYEIQNLQNYSPYVEYGIDFLSLQPVKKYDVCIMNPPFGNLGAYRFIRHVFDNWLSFKNSKIISVIPTYEFDNGSNKTLVSRKRKEWYEKHIERICYLPNDIFKDSGVKVIHSMLVEINGHGSNKVSFFFPVNKKDNQLEFL